MMKILIVPDLEGWACDNICDNIIRVLGDKFEFTKMYAEASCAIKGLPVFDNKKLDEYYFTYDLIYIMLPSYLKKGMDVEKTITTFHGGPGVEGQGDMMQRFGLNKMRVSYVSNQVKDRLTKYKVMHSNVISIEYFKKPAKLLALWNIDPATVIKFVFKISDADKKIIQSYITRYGYGFNDMFFTPHGVNLDLYPQSNEKPDGLVCGYAGWIKHFLGIQNEHRRSSWIINALKDMDFSLEIAGGLEEHVTGDFLKFRKMYIDDQLDEGGLQPGVLSGKNVQINSYSMKEMVDFYSKINCYLVPDKWAGGPMPVLEAGATGIAPVCTDAGLCGDIVEHLYNGYRVADEAEFIQGIQFMKDNPDERRRMGENMREYIVSNRTWEAVANYWEAFFLGEK